MYLETYPMKKFIAKREKMLKIVNYILIRFMQFLVVILNIYPNTILKGVEYSKTVVGRFEKSGRQGQT